MKKIYYYDKNTFIYVGEGPANLDPVATKVSGFEVYARPKYSTFEPVPKMKKGEQAIYNPNKDSWTVIKSNIGEYKLNSLTGVISIINDTEPLKSYECIINKNVIDDLKANPIKYDIINGKLVDISKIQKYKSKYYIRKYKKAIQEAKEAYIVFRDTPVDYHGVKYLPRYIDDYANLLNRTFPVEIWDATGTKSSLMSRAELQQLKDFLDELDRQAYSIKKHAIKKYKQEIEKLGGDNDQT